MTLTLGHKLLAAITGLSVLVLIVGGVGTFGARTMGGVFTDYRDQSVEMDRMQAEQAQAEARTAEQRKTAATGEISSNAQQAAEGARSVTEDVTGIQSPVWQTSTVSKR